MKKLISHGLAFVAGLMVALSFADRPAGQRGAASSSVHRSYYPSGALQRECPLDRSGRLHGEMREYDEAGELIGVIEMSHGQFVRGKNYRAD